MVQIIGVAQNPAIVLTPRSGLVYVWGTNMVFGPLATNPVAGTVTLSNLAPIVFTVQIDGVSGSFTLPVPDDTNTYNALDLMTRGAQLSDPQFHIAAGSNTIILTNNVLGIYTVILNSSLTNLIAATLQDPTVTGTLNIGDAITLGDDGSISTFGGIAANNLNLDGTFGSDNGKIFSDGNGSFTAIDITAQHFHGDISQTTGLVLPGALTALSQSNGVNLTNLDAPLFVRMSAPAQNAGYSVAPAANGEGVLLETSQDGINWYSATPNGTLLFTNLVGAHDCDLFLNSNGVIYSAVTYQGFNVTSTDTNFAILRSDDWINWTQVAIVNINTNATGVSWSPGIVLVNNKVLAYQLVWANAGTFNGQARGLTATDTTLTNWTTAASATILITNEAATTSGGPYSPTGNGVNDPYFTCINAATILTNTAGASVTIPSGTFLGLAYNWNTLNYDAYTNTQASQPAQLHLALTNITGFANGSEGGQVFQDRSGNWWFYGSVGNGVQKGRYFSSVNTNGMLGNFITQNLTTQNPRYTFGQGTLLALTGTNRANLQRSLLKMQGYTGNPYINMASAVSVRQLPGYTGPALAVRRSSDNLVANIGFTAGGDLDTNALLAFTGSGTATLAVWYDQSGLCNNYIQPTNGSQPCIVTNGVLNVDGVGRPTIIFGAPCAMSTERPVRIDGGFSAYSWNARPWATAAYSVIFTSADYNSGPGIGFYNSTGGGATPGWGARNIIANGLGYNATSRSEAFAWSTPPTSFTNGNNGNFALLDATVGSTNSGIWINASNVTSTFNHGPAASTVTNLYIGGTPVGDQNDGDISEVIIFPTCNPVMQQQQLRYDIMTYFSSQRTVVPPVLTSEAKINLIVQSNIITAGVIYKSNSLTTNQIYNSLANGDIWDGVLSNNRVLIYRTNNSMQITNLFKGQ